MSWADEWQSLRWIVLRPFAPSFTTRVIDLCPCSISTRRSTTPASSRSERTGAKTRSKILRSARYRRLSRTRSIPGCSPTGCVRSTSTLTTLRLQADADRSRLAASARLRSGCGAIRRAASSYTALRQASHPRSCSRAPTARSRALGRGQQFVAFGLHPSGAELEWFPDAPGQESVRNIPAISEDDLAAFFADAAPIIDASELPRINGHDVDRTSGEPQAEPLRIAAAVAAIRNDGPASWDEWNKIGMAIWRATGGADIGFAVFDAWSARNAAYSGTKTRERWDHYPTSPPTAIGAGTLFRMAREAGPLPPVDIEDEPAEPQRSSTADDSNTYAAIPFDPSRLLELEPYDWVYGRVMVKNYFCALGAPPGTGKSALIVIIALSIVTGRALLGGDPPEPGNCWIINLEDPAEAIWKMVWACCDYYQIDLNDLKGKLFINSGRDKALVVAKLVDGSVLRMPVIPNLTSECKKRQIRALFVDPVVDTHNLPENDNITMNDYCAIWNELAQKASLAVLLSMHFKKGGQGGDPDAFRGASAIIGKARSAITLSVMLEADAQKLNVAPDVRRLHLRMDNAKRNLSAPPTKADWLRLESVDLPIGDNIQTLRSWSPPSPWEGLPMAKAVAALEAIDAGNGAGEFYTASRRGRGTDRWAGAVILKHAERGMMSDDQAATILNQWLQSDVLEKGMYHSPEQRREIPCVRVNPGKLAEMRGQSRSTLPRSGDTMGLLNSRASYANTRVRKFIFLKGKGGIYALPEFTRNSHILTHTPAQSQPRAGGGAPYTPLGWCGWRLPHKASAKAGVVATGGCVQC